MLERILKTTGRGRCEVDDEGESLGGEKGRGKKPFSLQPAESCSVRKFAVGLPHCALILY